MYSNDIDSAAGNCIGTVLCHIPNCFNCLFVVGFHCIVQYTSTICLVCYRMQIQEINWQRKSEQVCYYNHLVYGGLSCTTFVW